MSNASPQQIKEIIEQNARIEHQLQAMNKDIKQISLTLANIQSKKGKAKKKGKKKGKKKK
jgi:hypothetical protein